MKRLSVGFGSKPSWILPLAAPLSSHVALGKSLSLRVSEMG